MQAPRTIASVVVSVGLSIPTDNDNIRKVLEPSSPSIGSRVRALERLHKAGIRTWVFVAPMLPMNPARLAELVAPHIDYFRVDSLNYRRQVSAVFRRHGWDYALTDQYATRTGMELTKLLGSANRVAKA